MLSLALEQQIAGIVGQALPGFAIQIPGDVDAIGFKLGDVIGITRGCRQACIGQEVLNAANTFEIGGVVVS